MIGKIVIGGWPRVVLIGLTIGGLTAMLVGLMNPLPFFGPELAPSSWRVAKVRGGTALRLAMVHDVLHERYLRHGSAWYAARNAEAQRVISARKGADDPAAWDGMDDLAVGLDRLGKGDEAAQVMRQKLAALPPLPVKTTLPTTPEQPNSDLEVVEFADLPPLSPLQHHHYTAHANLGTSLIHRSIAKAMAGDAEGKEMLREGLGHIEQAMAINPIAHFGRERWQAIAVQFILAATERPELWTKYDLCGDPIDQPGRAAPGGIAPGYVAKRLRGEDLGTLDAGARRFSREGIPRLVYASDWAKIVSDAYADWVPFDEPVLGLIGMWTMGGGPNPMAALTLGQIMERVDQPYIAFTAYERALEMKDRFGPSPEIREKLVAHCTQRQQEIAKAQQPGDPNGWMTQMRQTHEKELAWGRQYQKDYHDYEAQQIVRGVAIDDSHFYDGFFKGWPDIASDSGLADDMYVNDEHAGHWMDVLPLALVGSGVGMLLALAFPEKAKGEGSQRGA